jgi:sugar lactone lactonase YvrE
VTHTYEVEVAVEQLSLLGEGPAWDRNHNALVWVDILGGAVHRWLPSGSPTTFDVHTHVGAALPAVGGGWLLAVQDGFATMSEDGEVRPLLSVHHGRREDLRFNDGKVDPAGRAWAGTMAYSEESREGRLYRLDPGPTATPLIEGVGVSNGLGWSPDRRMFYYVDSLAMALRVFDYDEHEGTIRNERTLVTFPSDEGYLDGLCIDDDGCIWVAIWDGGHVNRYTSEGALDSVVKVPVDRPTSCCIGPGGMLYITSARHGLSEEQLARQPWAGAVFAAEVTTTAPPATLWQPLDGRQI